MAEELDRLVRERLAAEGPDAAATALIEALGPAILRYLRSMLRVLKPGGRLLVLEFSKPKNALLSKAYDAYSFRVLPVMGRLVANDADSYQYLAESIRKHPDQDTLKDMMEDAGFCQCEYHNMTGGIVALHRGIKA